jgi:hypothetical protein
MLVLWSPELDRYFVAAPANNKQNAAILVYASQDWPGRVVAVDPKRCNRNSFAFADSDEADALI